MSNKPFQTRNGAPGLPPVLRAVMVLVVLAGLGLWGYHAVKVDGFEAWRCLLVNFLFFNALGIGMVVWSAVVVLAKGRWAGNVEKHALAGVSLAPISLIAFAMLVALYFPAMQAKFGSTQWGSWQTDTVGEGAMTANGDRHATLEDGGDAHHDSSKAYWLSANFIFLRDGVGLAVLWFVAMLYVRARRAGREPMGLAAALVLLYCGVSSLLGFDLVMSLDSHWYSSLFGGYFFISGMYIAVAGWAIASLGGGAGPIDSTPVRRHDLGKLLVAFSLLTTYLMYSQLLAIWYENLPHEVRFVIPRIASGQWQYVSFALLGTIYLGPLVLLLGARTKQRPATLGAMALLVLAGMYVERWWLVTPTISPKSVPGLPDVALAAAMLAAAGLAIGWFRRRVAPGITLEIAGDARASSNVGAKEAAGE